MNLSGRCFTPPKLGKALLEHRAGMPGTVYLFLGSQRYRSGRREAVGRSTASPPRPN